MKNFGDGAGTNGAAAFTDGELGSLFHGDRVDQLNVEGDVVARHNHIDSGRKGDRAGDVGGVEEELWTIAVKEVGMTSAFFFLKDIGGGSEFVVWDDGSWLGKDLSTLDLVMGDTTEKSADVVAAEGGIKGLTEHFKTGDNGVLGWTDTNDFSRVVEFDGATLDTAGDDGTTTRDGHDVFDREKEWLVHVALWIRDIGVESVEKVDDALGVWIVGIGDLASEKGGATNDWDFVPREFVFAEKLTDIHLDELDEFFVVVDLVALVKEDDDLRNTDLTGEKDVLTGLRHNTFRSGDDKDRGVHLSGAGDHVLDVVGVPRAVDVSVVTLFGLVLDVSGVDGDTTLPLFWGSIDIGISHILNLRIDEVENVGDGRGKGGFAVVDVTDGTNVKMDAVAVEFFFCHFDFPPIGNWFFFLGAIILGQGEGFYNKNCTLSPLSYRIILYSRGCAYFPCALRMTSSWTDFGHSP